MNPNQTLFKTPALIHVATIALLVFAMHGGFAHAQDNSFFQPPERDNIIRDNAVAKADFQRSESAIPLRATALDLLEENRLTPDQESVPAEVPEWLSDLQSQASGVDIPKVLGSLALVLGGYFVFVWLSRALSGVNGDGGLPKEVVEVLGQTAFGPKKHLQLVRLGSKLLLLINSQDGTQSIGEITDPHEVEYLIGLCGGKRTSRSALAIRKASAEPANNGGGDLKRILNQLQQATDGTRANAVFEA